MIKKIATLFLAIACLSSCSSDDSSTPSEEVINEPVVPEVPIEEGTNPIIKPDPLLILPTQYSIDMSYVGISGISRGAGYTIDGDKLVMCGDGLGFLEKYTYSGNQITKIETYGNTTLYFTSDFTYENNKLKTFTRTIDDFLGQSLKYSYIYTHNENGTVSYVKSIISGKANGSFDTGKGTLTFSDGNIVKDEFFPDIVNATFYKKETLEYGYDSKNNWCKNIKGLNLLYNLQYLPTYGNQCATNNITRITAYEEVFNNNGSVFTPSREVYTTNYAYEYYPNDYPKTVIDLSIDVKKEPGATTFKY